MSAPFTKLFSSITTSTVWCESSDTRVVWITMLAMADRYGRIWASIPGLAKMATVSVEACQLAVDKFLAPDPYSRTKTAEGRRIEAIDGGWRLINHGKYRALRDEEERRVYKTQKQREYREREQPKPVDNSVDKVDRSGPWSTNVDSNGHNAEAEAEAEAEPFSPSVGEKEAQRSGGGENGVRPPSPAAGFSPDDTVISLHDQAEMVATAVIDTIGVTTRWGRDQIVRQAEFELRRFASTDKPLTMDALRDGMVSQWERYRDCVREGKLRGMDMGAEKFFGEGIWKDSAEWRLKKGMVPPPIPQIPGPVQPTVNHDVSPAESESESEQEQEVLELTSPEITKPTIRPEEFFDAWNRLRGPLPRVENFPESRKKKVQTRIQQGITLERFEQAVGCCTEKPFLRGDGSRGWTATFDWLVDNDRNIEKAINEYNGGGEKPQPKLEILSRPGEQRT